MANLLHEAYQIFGALSADDMSDDLSERVIDWMDSFSIDVSTANSRVGKLLDAFYEDMEEA